MAHVQEHPEDWILFLEAGFIAVNQADEDAARKLFTAAELLNPSNMMSKIGFGYLHLHKLELKQACHCFEAALKEEPHNEMAKALLGISLGLGEKTLDKGEALLRETHHSADPTLRGLSNTAIQFIEKFVRRHSPVKGDHRKRAS